MEVMDEYKEEVATVQNNVNQKYSPAPPLFDYKTVINRGFQGWSYANQYNKAYEEITNTSLKKMYEACFSGEIVRNDSAASYFCPIVKQLSPTASYTYDIYTYEITGENTATKKTWTAPWRTQSSSSRMITIPYQGCIWQPFRNHIFICNNLNTLIAYVKNFYKEQLGISAGGLTEEEVKALIDEALGEVVNGEY